MEDICPAVFSYRHDKLFVFSPEEGSQEELKTHCTLLSASMSFSEALEEMDDEDKSAFSNTEEFDLDEFLNNISDVDASSNETDPPATSSSD